MFPDPKLWLNKGNAAIDSDGNQISYSELADFSAEFNSAIGKRTLIFILSENCIGAMAGYVASLSGRVVPLILSTRIDKELFNNLVSHYQPEFFWIPDSLYEEFRYELVYRKFSYKLLNTGLTPSTLNEDLALLLPTSGSTGSPKLVRHSYTNIAENAKNVAIFFKLDKEDRAIAILPMHYTMGLSIVSSHLYAGSTLLLSNKSLTDPGFWTFIKENKATSFTGVPYSFEILHKLRFIRMDLPDLNLISQGGGKLTDDLFREFADFAERKGIRFIATYGQTEGTARMAYLEPELALFKTASIGKAIPNGHLFLIDEKGNTLLEQEATGELVYAGKNVTMGYAESSADLSAGDLNNGILHTGDIARRDSDGCYYIIGRKKRFLKLFGSRVSLDETEQLIRSNFNTECFCSGDDKKMLIYITISNLKESIENFISETTGIFHNAFEVIIVNEIPKNEIGKTIQI